MARLAETIAELVQRQRLAAKEGASTHLTEIADFGINPGQLKLLLYRPTTLSPGRPLVVVLHGCAQSAEGYARGAGWLALADRYDFAVLCPEQTAANNPNRCFNWFEPGDVARGSGEAASIASMVRFVVETHRLDAERVFISGLSAGGAMTAAMLATYPELFAAGSVVAGLPVGSAVGVQQALAAMRQVPALSPRAWGDKVRGGGGGADRWPRLVIWHGGADGTVAPGAGEALAAQWADVHHAETRGEFSASGADTVEVWRDAGGADVVALHRIAGMAHGCPISTAAPDACGHPGPWILDVGVSSSLDTAIFWGLVSPADPPVEHAPRTEPASPRAASRLGGPIDVGRVIEDALRTARLLR